MALIAQQLATSMKEFILTMNSKEQTDVNVSIDAFCQKLEQVVYAAIKSQTITIPPGEIITTGANSGGPVVSTNTNLVIINGTII